MFRCKNNSLDKEFRVKSVLQISAFLSQKKNNSFLVRLISNNKNEKIFWLMFGNTNENLIIFLN